MGKNGRSRWSALMTMVICVGITCLSATIDRLEREWYGVKPGVVLEGRDVEGYLPHELLPVLEEMALKAERSPQNPRLDRVTGEIILGQDGTTVDIEASLRRVLRCRAGQQVTLIRRPIKPEHSAEELKNRNRILGQFYTWAMGSHQRLHNMDTACSALNNQVLWPGQVFSFNAVVGPRTVERGYLLAPVMMGEEMVPGVGGGVCQVSTTLYNAVRLAGLPVLERTLHSGPVPYIEPGLDAAVSYDELDFKFRNNLTQPIIINCYLEQGRVTAIIRG